MLRKYFERIVYCFEKIKNWDENSVNKKQKNRISHWNLPPYFLSTAIHFYLSSNQIYFSKYPRVIFTFYHLFLLHKFKIHLNLPHHVWTSTDNIYYLTHVLCKQNMNFQLMHRHEKERQGEKYEGCWRWKWKTFEWENKIFFSMTNKLF